MARKRISVLARFERSESATSALEFAVAFPVLMILMVSGVQLVTYINATRKVELIAASISQMVSQANPPGNSTTATVNSTDLHFSYDAALVLFPYLMKDGPRQGLAWWQDITINYASIQFTQTSTSCTNTADMSPCYVANVVWTSSGIGNTYRPCVTPQLPASNTATPTRYTLPKSVFGAGSIIAVDVVFNFRPTFGSSLIAPVQIARTVYVQPRYASLINFDKTNSDGIADRCLGY